MADESGFGEEFEAVARKRDRITGEPEHPRLPALREHAHSLRMARLAGVDLTRYEIRNILETLVDEAIERRERGQ